MFSLIAWLPFYWVMILTPPVWVLLSAGFLASLFSGALNPIFQVALQVRTPEVMRPRVHSMVTAGNLMAVPIGALVIGPLIELLGVLEAFAVIGALSTAGAIACIFIPVFREFDAPVAGEG